MRGICTFFFISFSFFQKGTNTENYFLTERAIHIINPRLPHPFLCLTLYLPLDLVIFSLKLKLRWSVLLLYLKTQPQLQIATKIRLKLHLISISVYFCLRFISVIRFNMLMFIFFWGVFFIVSISARSADDLL